MHRDAGLPDRSEYADLGRAERHPHGKRDGPLGEILPAPTDVLLAIAIIAHLDLCEAGVGVLDPDHGVGTLRDRGPRHDACRFTCAKRPRGEGSRGDGLEHWQGDR